MSARIRYTESNRPALRMVSRLLLAASLSSPWAAQVAQGQTTDPFATLAAPSVPATVTVSQSGDVATPTTYVAYLVSLTNVSSRQISTISISGSVGVQGNLLAPVITSIGATDFCQKTATTFSCSFAALDPGAVQVIPVVVAVPTYSAAADGTEAIKVAYTATFKNGNTSSSSQSSFGTLMNTTTTLVAPLSAVSVKSLVIPGGGSFFTASNGISTPLAPLTTYVTVPPFTDADYTTAALDREDNTFCSNFKKCYAAKVSIPGYFDPYLTIVLRQDATNIKNGTKIESVLIKYTSDDNSIVDRVLQMCASPTTPRSDGVPCIAKTTYYKSPKNPPPTPEFDGDFEWTIINHKNGRYGTE